MIEYFDVILVFATLIFILISLYFDLLGPGFTFLIGVTVLVLFGILTPQEMLSGVANEHVAVVILLLLLGSVFEETGVLTGFFHQMFSDVRTPKGFIFRLMVIIAPLSAFLNNTPLVALMLPFVKDWSKRKKVPVTKLLIPLSYAAILGGTATLIGTSTNMIINGLIADQQKYYNGLRTLEIFDFTPVGATMIVIGTIYMYFVGYHLLPSRSKKHGPLSFVHSPRQYAVEIQITANSPLVGKKFVEISDKFKGLYLFQIIRGDKKLHKNLELIRLKENDTLIFGGTSEAISDLLEESGEVRIPTVGMFLYKKNLDIVEIVIATNSWMINKTLRNINFRAKYDATPIAIHRNGEQIRGKITDVKLKAGDAILLLAGEKFWILSQNTRDFYIISKVKEIRKLDPDKAFVLIFGTFLVILLAALKIVSLFVGLIVLLIILTIFKITTPKKLGEKVDYDLGFLIVMALAFGKAMLKTNTATLMADFLIDLFKPFGKIGILVVLYLITTLVAGFITNKAAVAIIFPIALTIAKDLNINPTATILTMAYAAAANFITPIGYQTNTMVYGAGGYKFRDFIKVGGPLTIIYGIVAITIISLMYL